MPCITMKSYSRLKAKASSILEEQLKKFDSEIRMSLFMAKISGVDRVDP